MRRVRWFWWSITDGVDIRRERSPCPWCHWGTVILRSWMPADRSKNFICQNSLNISLEPLIVPDQIGVLRQLYFGGYFKWTGSLGKLISNCISDILECLQFIQIFSWPMSLYLKILNVGSEHFLGSRLQRIWIGTMWEDNLINIILDVVSHGFLHARDIEVWHSKKDNLVRCGKISNVSNLKTGIKQNILALLTIFTTFIIYSSSSS